MRRLASILYLSLAPTRYMGMFESTKITEFALQGNQVRFPRAFGRSPARAPDRRGALLRERPAVSSRRRRWARGGAARGAIDAPKRTRSFARALRCAGARDIRRRRE